MLTRRRVVIACAVLAIAAVFTLFARPAYMRTGFSPIPTPDNSPPTAVPDHYTLHRSFETPIESPRTGVLKNDSDPDDDPLMCNFSSVTTSLGTATIFTNGKAAFEPAYGQTGSVEIPYIVCDNHDACAGSTVTFDVTNEAPVANDDEYTVHGTFETPIESPYTGVLKNDTDAEGDHLTAVGKTVVGVIGTAIISANGKASFIPANNQTGDMTITYTVCDDLGACSEGEVTFHVVNHAPIAGSDVYIVRDSEFETPLETPNGVLKNDSDPDLDPIQTFFVRYDFPQGSAFVSQTGKAIFVRNPNYPDFLNFFGSFVINYTLCDDLGACSQGYVTFWLLGGGVNLGAAACNAWRGGPVNVTNGNMYLQQTDYSLPSVGPGLGLTRTSNSGSQRIGLFGIGWSGEYDESITGADSNLARLDRPDGRSVYLGRDGTSSGPLLPLEGDFHGSLLQNGASGFTLTMTNGDVHQFNSAGKLVSLSDRVGNQTVLGYDGNGKLISVTDPFGRVLSLTNLNGLVASISDTMGTVATYSYNANKLASVTYADNSTFVFGYDGGNRLTSVTDALGNLVESHTYDGQGRALTSARQDDREHYTFNFLSETETDVTDGLGHVTKFTLDKSKGRNLVTQVEGLCSCGGSNSQIQSWIYDDRLNVSSKTDGLGHVTSFTYDANGNRLTETEATGTVTYTYNGFAEVLTRTDQLNGVTTNTYDNQGNLLTTSDALNNTTTLTYNTQGQPLTVTDARNHVTTFIYDSSGNPTYRVDANGISRRFFYDDRSRLTKVRDELSRDTLIEYDDAWRLKKVKHPDNSFRTRDYDLAGRLTVSTDERGNETHFGYDGAYRLTSVTDPLNHLTIYGYDDMSRMTSQTDALSRLTDYEYDAFNRLKKIIHPPASTGATRLFEMVAYDDAGNVIGRTDTAGRVTAYGYDDVSRLTSITDADSKTTNVAYDALSRVIGVTDALNQQYEFAYDALGRQTQMARNGDSMSYAYDEVGNRTQRTDFNGTVTDYAYDNLNRLTSITYPSRSISYAYTVKGQLLSATNENGSIYLSYDNRDRLSSVFDPFNYGVSYQYDAVGNRTGLSVNSSTYATYSYDAANRMTSLKDAANLDFSHTYDAVNRLTSRSAPNGVVSSYGYDGLDRLTALTHALGAATLIQNEYSYDSANNISNWIRNADSAEYEYDVVDRLTTASHNVQPNESYSYDEVGNRLSSHLNQDYTYKPFNKLWSTDSASYQYDNNGNLLFKVDGDGETSFTWNEENQLTRVDRPDGDIILYTYDALGRRIQHTTRNSRVDERYVYDGADVLLDLNEDWSVAISYLNGPGVDNHLRQTNATSGVSYFLTDHLGSTAALANSNGDLVEEFTYDSFGNATSTDVGNPGQGIGIGGIPTSTNSRTRYTYTGREFDADTGLYYYRARWYDPQVGRFISEDPIGLAGGLNLFTYVANKPLQFVDPTGTQIRSDRNWYEGEEDPITHKILHNDFRQLAGMGCALDGFNPWISVEVGGGFHALWLGGNAAAGAKFNFFTMETCFYIKKCVRSGFGVFAGGGANAGFSFGRSQGALSRGFGGQLGFDAAVPGAEGRLAGRGGSGNLNLSGLGIGAGPTVGAGVSGGLDFCHWELVCYNTPNCSCSR